MQRNITGIALVSLTTLLFASCRSSTPDEDNPAPVTTNLVQSSSLLIDRTVAGASVSVFATYSDSAPADHMHPVFLRGVHTIGDISRHRRLVMKVTKSALPNVLTTLKALPWITSIHVDSVIHIHGSSRPAAMAGPRSIAMMRRWRSDEIPWGIVYAGAKVVDSASANTGSDVKIGIIDSGVDCSNGDLTDQVVGGYDYIDEAANGCTDPNGHGTAVAGIIAASGNGTGVIGMAPGAKLYSYRVVDTHGDIAAADLVLAFDAATTAGVQVINLSIADCGTGEEGDVLEAIADAQTDGAIVVAAAGNGYSASSDKGCGTSGDDSVVSQLARQTGVVAVSSFDSTGVRDTHGQYGSTVALSGPEYVDTDSTGSSGIWHSFSGTSAAAPHVTGAIALAISAGQGDPVGWLESNAHYGPSQTGKDNYYGYGQVDVRNLLPIPIMYSVDWCTEGNITSNDELDGNHACLFTATIHAGAPAYEVQYTIVESYPYDSTVLAWGPPAQAIYIPNTTVGYTMRVTAIVRDAFTQRAGSEESGQSFYVCNITSGGGEPLLRVHPDYPTGCDPDERRAPITVTAGSPNPLAELLKAASPASPGARPKP